MYVIVLQWKCPLAISKRRKVKSWTTLSTFFWHDTSKNVKSPVFLDFEKKTQNRILELWRNLHDLNLQTLIIDCSLFNLRVKNGVI